MSTFNVICLGAQDMTPVKNLDCSHYLINEHILVDCGTSPVMNMLNLGVDLSKITHIIFTHLHPDHAVGFASLYFYLTSVLNHKDMSCYTIMGPKGEIEEFVRDTVKYSRCGLPKGTPIVVPLDGGEEIIIPDNGGKITLSVISAHHAVKGECLKFTKNGRTIGFSGDTSFFPQLTEFFLGCDALVHESSFPKGGKIEDKLACGHSGPEDVALVANGAHVKRVYIVHAVTDHAERISSFKELSDIPASFLSYGEKIIIK